MGSIVSAPWAEQGRVLYLVRHGQYEMEEGSKRGHLTGLGRRQSRLLGKWLRQFPIQRVGSSDLIRAVQTAELLASALGIDKVKQDKHFREVLPSANPEDVIQLQRAAKKLNAGVKGSRHEVIVCHGNFIRLLLCDWLQAPANNFSTFVSSHTGVTRVWITKGKVRVLGYNDLAHLPSRLQTIM